jgi:hypothetical protein
MPSEQPDPGSLNSTRRPASLKTINKKQKLGVDPKQVEPTSKRQAKKRLTFDLPLLRLEGLARVLSRLPQAENHGFLLLEGLAQVLVRDAELGQLPVEPRDFFVPLLEGCLRPLEYGALLL